MPSNRRRRSSTVKNKGLFFDELTIKPLKINGETLDIAEYLSRDYGDISEASEVLPGLIEFINQEYEFAVEDKLNLKMDVKRRTAEVYQEIRNPRTWEAVGFHGKPTEKAIDHAINMDDDLTELTEKYNRASALVARLAGLMNTLQLKLDLVRTTEATKRKAVFDGDGGGRSRSRSMEDDFVDSEDESEADAQEDEHTDNT